MIVSVTFREHRNGLFEVLDGMSSSEQAKRGMKKHGLITAKVAFCIYHAPRDINVGDHDNILKDTYRSL